jgi:hypothetical protein
MSTCEICGAEFAEQEGAMTTKAEKHEVEAHKPAVGARADARETTDVDDIQALADAVVATIQTAAFDDMTWNEVDHALRRASSLIKLNWQATGTVQPAPVDPPAVRAAPAKADPARTYPG